MEETDEHDDDDDDDDDDDPRVVPRGGVGPLENKIKSGTPTRGSHEFSRVSELKSRSHFHMLSLNINTFPN